MTDLGFKIPEYKKIRVIVDTDAACEADDPYAIVQALLSPKLIVEGIVAEHFVEEGSTERSLNEIKTILKCMKLSVPAYAGQSGPLSCHDNGKSDDGKTDPEGNGNPDASQNATDEISEGVHYIIKEALKDATTPLYILGQGAITNVAMAFRVCPKIIDRVRIIWIGTHGAGDVAAPFREFNAGNDVTAANEVLTSGADIWLVPSDVYTTISVGIAELKYKVEPCGEIGKHLFENLANYNLSESAFWTQGESWSLGDSPAIAIAINPGCGRFITTTAPHIAEDTSSVSKPDNPVIRVYKDVDSRYILEDFYAKLRLFTQH